MLHELEIDVSSYMSGTKSLRFDFVRMRHFPYDDEYYDEIEKKNDELKSQLRKEPDDEEDSQKPEEPIIEAQDRLLLAIFFTEDLLLRRLEYVIWPNGKVLPHKIERHSWDLLPVVEMWAIKHTMSFKSMFGPCTTK